MATAIRLSLAGAGLALTVLACAWLNGFIAANEPGKMFDVAAQNNIICNCIGYIF